MPTVAALLELQGLEAKNEQLRTQAQENLAKAKLYGEQADLMTEDAALQRQTREVMKAAQEAADAARGEVTPESTAAVAQIENPVQKVIRDSMQTIKEQRALGDAILRAGGDSKAAQKAYEIANTADQTMRHNLNLAFNQQKEAAEKIGAAAGSVLPDGSNLPQVKAALEAVAPGMWTKAGLDEDVYGNPAWTPRTQKYLATLQTQATTAEKQLELRQKELDRQQREATARATEEERKRIAERHDQDMKLRREGIDVRKEENDLRRNERKDAAAERAAARAETAANRLPVKDEVDATATKFQSDPEIKLLPSDAKLAAWDYHRMVNDLLRVHALGVKDGAYSREEAEADALATIKARTKPKTTKEGTTIFGYELSSPTLVNEYKKWSQSPEGKGTAVSDAGMLKTMTELQAVGVGYKQTGDKITLSTTPKTPPAKAALIAKAQEAINSGKYDPAKVIEILKQQMVK